MTIYRNLWICSLNQEQHERTCNYWYTVTSNATAHTAFTTRAALLRWLEDRNLTVADPIPEVGTWGTAEITGEYATEYHLEAAEFDALVPVVERRKVDNGQYTLARITDSDGFRTVHLMNCNYPRVIFDYAESRKLEDAPLFTLPEDPQIVLFPDGEYHELPAPEDAPAEPQIEFEYHMMSPANLDIVNDCIDYAWPPNTIAGCWAHLDKLLARGTIPRAQYDEIKAGGDFIIAD